MMEYLDTIDSILLDAKADNRKGNYGVYNYYKQRLGLLCSSSEEYEDSCKKLATALRV